jgi:hypothetical protein
MVREWTADDLREPPPGTEPGPPHFVGVGVPKAGTTWWFDLVAKHPHVVPNRFGQKELQFFCRDDAFRADDDVDRALYRAAFVRGAREVSGEWTPNYITHPRALDRLVAAAPDTRILLLVRDPVDRLHSHLNHHAHLLDTLRLQGDEAGFVWRYLLFPDAVRASCIADDVAHLLSLVPRERLLVLQHERCRDDPDGELRRTYEFLEVDPDISVDSLREPVNSRARRLPPVEPEERRRAAEHFEDQARRLCELLPEVDAARWPSLERPVLGR